MSSSVQRVQRVAHRGGSSLAPENTLSAFRNALTMPVDAIELDVQLSRDGHLVVFHDNTIERLTRGEGNLLDLDFAYLRTLDTAAHFPGGWPKQEQIPTLREVLDLVRGRVKIYIEIKLSKRDGVCARYPGIVEMVVREVKATKMLQQVLIISFDWAMLHAARALEPALRTGIIVSTDNWTTYVEQSMDMLIERAKTLGAGWINMDRTLVTPAMPAQVHLHNLKLGIWTANTIDELRRFAAAGVDALTTDRPDLFAEL